MRRAIVSSLAAAMLAGLAFAGAPGAHADQRDELLSMIRDDLTILSVNTPVWMAQHLPGVMPAAGLGAGTALSDDSGGFSFGILTRLGLLSNFNDIAYGLQLADLEPHLPSLLPWPQLGVIFGVGLGDGMEIGADIQFIPNLDIAGDNINLKAGLFSGAATFRWRVNRADGAIPAIVLGLGATYYTGSFEVGAGFSGPYSEVVEGRTVEGTYSFSAAPGVSWSLFQVSPEIRLAWDIGGVIRPYLGFGAGFSFGTVSNRARLRASVSVDSVDGEPTNEPPIVYEHDGTLFETSPALYTLRPHLGLDIVIGVLAITVQLDLAVMGKDSFDTDFSGAAGHFDASDPNFLFARNQAGSQTNAAAVLTVATRLQF